MEEDIKNLKEIVDLCEKEIKNNDDNTTAILDIADLKSLKNILNELDRLQKENEALKEQDLSEDFDKAMKYYYEELDTRVKLQLENERLQKENELAKETIKKHCSDMDNINNILAKLQKENEEMKFKERECEQ